MSSILLFAVLLSPLTWLVIIRPIILLFSPSADTLRIKRDLERNGSVVAKVERTGSSTGSLYCPVYRRYHVLVLDENGREKSFEALVRFSLLATDKELLIFPL